MKNACDAFTTPPATRPHPDPGVAVVAIDDAAIAGLVGWLSQWDCLELPVSSACHVGGQGISPTSHCCGCSTA